MKIKNFILSITLFFFAAISLSAQSLPEKLQDLPPELKQGLPYNMDYEEYRIMKKNLTFPKIFLAAMLPGYAHYYAEKKMEAGIILGIRMSGYALMGTGFYLQMNNLEDLLNLSSLSDSSMEKLKTNAYIFLGGVLLNAAGFFYDWAGAERVIDYQKSKVLYKYGLFKNYGGYNEDSLIQYIRKLLLQDNNRLKSQLEHSLITYIKTYPWGKYTGEAEYYLASFYKRKDKYNEALIHSIRQIYLYPEFSLTPIAKQRVIDLTVENSFNWKKDISTIREMVSQNTQSLQSSLPQNAKNEERYLFLLSKWNNLTSMPLVKEGITEANRFMKLFPKSKKKDIILLNIAKQAEKIRDYNLAIKIYTEIANIHSDTSLARKAIVRLADIFYNHINDKKLANYYYNELIESYPSSKEAKIAKEKLK